MRAIFTLVKHQRTMAFYTLLFACLFLGDAKQGHVDLFGTAAVLAFFFACLWKGKQKKTPQKSLLISWLLLFGYLSLRTPFSDDIGYSVFSYVRHVDAFVVFYLFYAYSEKEDAKSYVVQFLFFVVAATALSLFYSIIGTSLPPLPFMNLLQRVYNHNHLVDIVFPGFVISCLLGYIYNQKRFLFLSIGLWLVTIFTLARAAIILTTLVVLGVGARAAATKTHNITKILTTTSFVFISLVAVFVITSNSIFGQPIFRTSTEKQGLVQNVRTEYWNQAIAAIKERPLFGSGPGTFYLQSVRLQKNPMTHSWFAHNFVLEYVSDNGLVGLGLLMLVFYQTVSIIIPTHRQETGKTSNKWATSLAGGIIMLFMYSLVDYPLNYFVVWVWFWGSLGVLASSSRAEVSQGQHLIYKTLLSGCIGILLIFYALFVLEETLWFVTKSSRAAPLFPADVYLVNKAVSLLSPLDSKATQLLSLFEFFHKRNPEVLFVLANKATDLGATESANQYYQRALEQDGLNNRYAVAYIEFLLDRDLKKDIGPMLQKLAREREIQTKKPSIDIDFFEPHIFSLYIKPMFVYAGENPNQRLYYSKIYYYLGFQLIHESPEQTKKLWQLASFWFPELGYYYTELAAIERNEFKNNQGAQDFLEKCKEHERAWLHCKQIQSDHSNLHYAGALVDIIRNTNN